MSTKTFDPNRVQPGTIELVRDANGNYTTKVVGLQTINSLSLPEISTTAAVTKTDDGLVELKKEAANTLKDQTQMAFKTGDDRGPDTTGSMLQDEAKKTSDMLANVSTPTTIQDSMIRSNRFDADTFDDKVGSRIEDPTEKVFGKSTVEDAQKERQTTLPDLSVDVEKKEPPGLFGFKFDRPIQKEDFLGDRFKATETRNTNPNLDQMAADAINRQEMISGATADDATANTLGITAEPVTGVKGPPSQISGPQVVGGTDLEADAGTKARTDIKPKESALKTLGNSVTTALKNIKTPMMMVVDMVATPRGESAGAVAHNKKYFTDRGDGRIGGNPATDLYAGFNRVSKFGNLAKAGDKRLARRQKTIEKKGYKAGDKFYDDTQKMKDQANDYKQSLKEAPVTGTTKPGEGGGSGATGGGKIVCTMMNESYGFGSFRNKIWMKFHGNIAPEYQKGYHKLFLPLVNYAKQKGIINKIIKNILEHIAVHSTIDMRQTLRGKRHTLGRLYRKVILPLCYWAGKK